MSIRWPIVSKCERALIIKARVGILRQVASTVSHELRNPLAAIRTSVAVLRTNDVKQGGRAAPTFERIERTIQRCTRIIMSLVDYTHLDDVDRKAIEIDMWLSDWLDRQPPVDDIVLQRDLNSAVILEVDPERLGQALASLVENAVHALTAANWQPPADRQRQIAVRTELTADKVRLSVADNGCGIPPENLSRIFEPQEGRLSRACWKESHFNLSPPRKRGSRASDRAVALDSRFRGNDIVSVSSYPA